MTKKDKNNQNINNIPKYLWGNYFKKPIKWLAHLINNYGNSKLSFITTGTSYAYAIADEKRKHPELTELQIKENVDLRIKQNRKKLGLPTENTPSLAAAGLALGSLYYPWLAVPDIIFDTAASIDEPSTSNNLHTIADFPETVAKFTPSKIDDYVAKGILTLGNIDDAVSTSGRNIFSIFDKKTGKINNTVDKTSVRESTNIKYRKNGGRIRKMQTASGGPIKKSIKRLKDGYRYIPNEQNGGWNRISDNSMADVFATMEFTPKKTKVGSSITRKQFIPSKIDYNSDDIVNVTRRRLYRNITPFGYHNPISRTLGAITLNQQDDTRTEENKRIKNSVPEASALDALWATYLNIPENQRRNINPKYGISKTKDGYYRFNSPGMIFNFEQDLSPHGLFGLPGRKAVMMNGILGNYTTGLGRDTKGDYIFYSDSKLNPDGTPNIKTGWDINPYSNTVDNDTEETTEEYGQYGQDKKDLSYKIGKALFGNVEDISMGLGTPVPIYDKIYLDDIYNVSGKERGGYYLPEITVTRRKKLGGKMNILEFLKNGSSIHIKEKNKGKFTSYCGGKVTDECIRKAKASGNPTLVKRATFAANARKWKHKEGGIIVKAADGTKTNLFLKVGNFLNSDLGKTVGTGLVNAFSSWTSSNKLNNAIDSWIEGLKKQNKADINSIQDWALQKATEEITLKFNELLLLFNSGASFEQPSPIVFEHLKSLLANKYAQQAINDANLNSQEAIANLESYKTNPTSDVLSSLVNTGFDYLSNKFANKALDKNGVPSSKNTSASFYSNPYLKTQNKVGTINSDGSMNTGIGGTTYNWKTNTFGSNSSLFKF